MICLEFRDHTLWNFLTNVFTGHRLGDKSFSLSFGLNVILKGLYHFTFPSMDTQLIARISLEVTWSNICCSVVSKEQPPKKISRFSSTVVNVLLSKFSEPLTSENLLILPLRREDVDVVAAVVVFVLCR